MKTIGWQKDHIDLLKHIEEAGRQPLFWHEALKALSKKVGDAAIGLILENPNADGPGFGSAVHFDSEKMIEWGERYYDADPWTQANAFPLPGQVSFCPTAAEQLAQTAYFQHWMKPQGFLPEAMILGCLNGKSRQKSQTLGFYSREQGRALTENDRQFILQLLPHVQQAAAVSRTVLGLEPTLHAHTAALSLVRIPILHLDRIGRIRWSNREMQELVRAGHGPTERDGLLRMPTRISESQLRDTLAELATAESGTQVELLVPHRQGGLPFRLTFCRTQAAGTVSPDQELFVVFGSTRHLTIEGDDNLLMRTFKLSRSEARLAIEMLAGATTKEVAKALTLTEETVRQYRKRIFSKTGARNQSDLLRLLTREVISAPRSP